MTLAEFTIVGDPHIFVGLVGEIEDAGTIGDAVAQLADPVDVLLVVGARRAADLRGLAQHLLDRVAGHPHHRAIGLGHRGTDLEEISDLVAEVGTGLDQAVEHGPHLGLHFVEVFLDQQASVEHDTAAIGHDRGGQAAGGVALAAVDGIDVQRRRPRALRHDRHGGRGAAERRENAPLHLVDHRAHVAHGVVAQEGHGAMGDAALGGDLRPPDAPVADADADPRSAARDDHVVDARLGEPAPFGEIGDAAVAAGFLVGGAGDLQRAGKVDARVRSAPRRR